MSGGSAGVFSGDDVGEAVVAELAFLIVQVEASVFTYIHLASGASCDVDAEAVSK